MAKIKAACPSCQKQFAVAPEAIGKKAKCSGCQKVFVLAQSATPAVSAKPTPPSQRRKPPVQSVQKSQHVARHSQPNPVVASTAKAKAQVAVGAPNSHVSALSSRKQNAATKIQRLKPLLDGKTIKTGRVSILYRINILFTTFVMFLLPIIYVCLIVVVGFLVYYHATHHAGMMSAVRGRGAIFMVILFVTPILGGVVLIFFMLKPLLARPGNSSRRRKINPRGEPVLFWFVERICNIVGAPVPKQIYITHDINAAASFEHGMRSAMIGRNLSLHIGIPLVGGMNLQQFGGVLAHEFGHFSQGAGMRLSTFIRSVNFWFARVVYERDAWDEGLESLVDEDTDFRFALIIWFVQICVFLSRAILWVLMMFGHMVSCLLLRQMEFDADKYEIQFGGSENFEQTSDRLQILNAAYGAIIPTVVEAAVNRKTVKNLPKSILEKSGSLDPKLIKDLLKQSHSNETGLLDSHPSDGQRIEKARKAAVDGVFHCTAPAEILFSNFSMTCESITDDFYRNEFGVSKQMIQQGPRRRRG